MFNRRIRGLFKPKPSPRVRWFLVATRSSARIFEQKFGSQQMGLVSRLDHPDQGRLLLEEINKGRPRASDVTDLPEPMLRHAMGVETSREEEETKRFAKTIDVALKKGRWDKRYNELVLVAEPGFMGLLLARLDRGTLRLVVDKVHKDLGYLSDAEVRSYFDKTGDASHQRVRATV